MNLTSSLQTRNGEALVLHHIPMTFDEGTVVNVFAKKNNKTLGDTLQHRRYRKLKDRTIRNYPDSMKDPLGLFLHRLKQSGNDFYKRFLNPYGDLKYSRFRICDEKLTNCKGIYAYFVEDRLKYIGRCRDSMKQRIDQGYGRIHPKNCYIDGQATNCRINSIVTETRPYVSLWLHPMEYQDHIIESLERDLIARFEPEWNIQGQS